LLCAACALFAVASAAAAQPAASVASVASAPVVKLDESHAQFEFAERRAWIGPAGRATISSVAAGRVALGTVGHAAVLPLERGRTMWMQLRLQRAAAASHHWILEIPMPLLDSATLYEREPGGRWVSRTAGDHYRVDTWPEVGRYPFFRLDLDDEALHDLYLEVEHGTPLSLPLRLVTAAEHDRLMRLEYLGLGMAFGALLLLTAWSISRAWRLQDPVYAWYSGYALLNMLTVGAFTGIASHLAWGNMTWWADASPGCLALLAGGSALGIVRSVTEIVTRSRWLGLTSQVAGWAGPLLAVAYLFMDRRAGAATAGAYLLVVTVLAQCAAVVTWRRGDPVGRWMTLGSVPLAIAVIVSIARVFGWLEASWFTDYVLVLALTIDLPLLLGAINSRSRERRGARLRQLASASQDPLTGLLKLKPFSAHLTQALLRYHRRGEGAAAAIVELANHGWIKSSLGPEAAEESLLRAVIKLRGIVRDVDTTGRVGEARFGLILESVNTRAAVSQVASRLIATGLMTDAERPDDPPLQFHVAASLLAEASGNAQELLDGLASLLGTMSVRTRRPLRFLEEKHSEPDPGASESAPLTANAE
jgi:GGDEF domain-containing protein